MKNGVGVVPPRILVKVYGVTLQKTALDNNAKYEIKTVSAREDNTKQETLCDKFLIRACR